jgi:hypothetical protein
MESNQKLADWVHEEEFVENQESDPKNQVAFVLLAHSVHFSLHVELVNLVVVVVFYEESSFSEFI